MLVSIGPRARGRRAATEVQQLATFVERARLQDSSEHSLEQLNIRVLYTLFELVTEMDLEGIVAKRLADPYAPETTTWWKVLNAPNSQREGRSERFERGSCEQVGRPSPPLSVSPFVD
jgi:ATP-dependent DNA ligase